MNTKILLGLTLAAVLAMAVVSPAVAETVTGIKKTEFKVKDGEIDKLKFHLDDKVAEDTFGGYAIFTEGGSVVAYTSHPGVYDSTSQTAPTSDQIDLEIGAIAAGCSVTPDVACGGEWHSHLVVPDANSPYCDFAAISELTFNEPANKVKAKGKHVEGKDIAMGTGGFVGAISGVLEDFTVGAPADADGTTDKFDGAAFDLNPVKVDGDLKAICIGVVTEEIAGLCTEIDESPAFPDEVIPVPAGTGQAYKLEIGGGGVSPENKVQIGEFPYSDALWAEINTTIPPVPDDDADPAAGLGGVELQNWYNANCVVLSP